jgi:hypothetical protein
MRKLFITCDCGQQMQVPRSAIGKMGQCPSCGEKIPINRDTTSRTPQARASVGGFSRNKWGSQGKPSVDAKQRFGRAVDLYCAGHYGEALALFDSLQEEFPDSMEIERARRQCIEARNRGPINLPEPDAGQVAGDALDDGTLRALRRIAVEKMLHGATDAVQLQAAELVARLAGLYDRVPRGSGEPREAYPGARKTEPETGPRNGGSFGNAPDNGHANTGERVEGFEDDSEPAAQREGVEP